MYVDDLMGACSVSELAHDLGIAQMKCNGFLGPDTVEETKTTSGRRIDWIGWTFDVDTQTVSVAMHNFLRTLHGFLQCREKESVTVREFTRLASWSARYSAVCRPLKPFTKDLF
jgi:hypothetical protein